MRKRIFIRLILGSVVVFVLSAVSPAAVPPTINYQGYLIDSSGEPVNATVNMTFGLYTSPTGTDSQVWTETQMGVTVANGRYSVILGSVTPLSVPFDAPYYLGVKVGADQEMTPRQTLTSTGYAMRAVQADSISSMAGIATQNPIVSTLPDGKPPLQVQSATLVTNLNADMVDGKHATDFVAKTGDTMTGNLAVPSATLTGILTLPTTTTNVGIIMQAGNTLIHTYGDYNFFAGINAGNLTMTGSYNTANGYYALLANTGGGANTASGYSTLRFNTTGANNTASGYSALRFNTTGAYNTASGHSALYSNTTGNSNTASGYYALYSNTTGVNNTTSGYSALQSNTTGNFNTSSGYSALYSNTTGEGNTASGSIALYSNTTGYNNTANGIAALYYNTTGYYNTASGYQTLFSNTTGTFNTAYGTQALYSNITGYYNTASGTAALYSNITGTYNTSTGVYALNLNTVGYNNTANGSYALLNNTTGINNTASGSNALFSNTTGQGNTAIGYDADVSAGGLTNATAIGYGATVDASNKVRIGNTNVTVIEGNVAFTVGSDIRIKKDVEDIGCGLGFIKQLRPVQYRLKEGNDRIDFGFIAQDIELTLGTEYNILGIGGTEDRMLSLRYTDFIAPMVKAMQEQQDIIEKQQTMIETLTRRLEKVETLLSGKQ